MVLGKLPVPGRPTIWITVGQGPTALAVGAGGGCLDIFTLICLYSPLSPSLWETARYRLKYRLNGVGRFRILGEGANSQQAHDVASSSFRRHVPIRFLINQCQIIIIKLKEKAGGLLGGGGGGGKGYVGPPPKLLGGWPAPPPPLPLPTPMCLKGPLSLKQPTNQSKS